MKRLLSALLLAGLFSSCQTADPRFGDFEICDDNFDNNSNGFFDCSDDECRTIDPVCARPEQCEDRIDNDFNGDTDCQDDVCGGTPDCMCIGTSFFGFFQLPLVIEGDTAEGVFAVNVLGCQTGEARESFFNFGFLGVPRIDILVEPLDGVEMVLQITDDCGDNVTSSCQRTNGVSPLTVRNFDTDDGPNLFFVGAREAGQTGRFRLTFSETL